MESYRYNFCIVHPLFKSFIYDMTSWFLSVTLFSIGQVVIEIEWYVQYYTVVVNLNNIGNSDSTLIFMAI